MINISVVINYKLLVPSANSTQIEQMLFIFNRLYGGDPKSQISDTVSIIAEAGILESLALFSSTDFYDQIKIEQAIFNYLKESFHDYYLTCSSVFIINMEFDLTYQNAIVKISAEAQKIAEKQNLLNGTQIQSQMSVAVSQITQTMALATATNLGKTYAIVQAARATAIQAFYTKLSAALALVGTFGGTNLKNTYKFFYLLVSGSSSRL
jgi:hypothetical protein